MQYGLKVVEADLRWHCNCPECGADVLVDLIREESEPVECSFCSEEFYIESDKEVDSTTYC